MSSFSITNNLYLRTLYGSNRAFASTTNRKEETCTEKLSAADQAALRKGIKGLADFEFDEIDDDTSAGKTKVYNTLKAFADAYNNCLETGSSSSNTSVQRLTNKMKSVSSSYSDTLDKYGITFDNHGYMSVSKSAVENIHASNYKSILGSDSSYMKELSKYSSRISTRVDAYA